MKKRLVSLAAAIFILSSFNLSYAAGLGPIRPLGNMKLAAGVENDFVFSRRIKAVTDVTGGEIKESNNNFLLLGVGVTDYVNIYAKLGAGNLSEQLKWSGISSQQAIDYNYGFIWGVGMNALYEFKNNFGLGLDTQFNMGTNKAKSISGTSDPEFIDGRGPITTYEFQIAPYASYDFKVNDNLKIMPYLGGYYSFYKIHKGILFADYANDEFSTEDEKVRTKNKVGPLVGIESMFFNRVSFKIEGRFVAETAISTSLTYNF